MPFKIKLLTTFEGGPEPEQVFDSISDFVAQIKAKKWSSDKEALVGILEGDGFCLKFDNNIRDKWYIRTDKSHTFRLIGGTPEDIRRYHRDPRLFIVDMANSWPADDADIDKIPNAPSPQFSFQKWFVTWQSRSLFLFFVHPGNYMSIALLAMFGAMLISSGFVAGSLVGAVATATVGVILAIIALPIFVALKTFERKVGLAQEVVKNRSLRRYFALAGIVLAVAALVFGLGYFLAPLTFAFMAPFFTALTGALSGGFAAMAAGGLGFMGAISPVGIAVIAVVLFVMLPLSFVTVVNRMILFHAEEGGFYNVAMAWQNFQAWIVSLGKQDSSLKKGMTEEAITFSLIDMTGDEPTTHTLTRKSSTPAAEEGLLDWFGGVIRQTFSSAPPSASSSNKPQM